MYSFILLFYLKLFIHLMQHRKQEREFPGKRIGNLSLSLSYVYLCVYLCLCPCARASFCFFVGCFFYEKSGFVALLLFLKIVSPFTQ